MVMGKYIWKLYPPRFPRWLLGQPSLAAPVLFTNAPANTLDPFCLRDRAIEKKEANPTLDAPIHPSPERRQGVRREYVLGLGSKLNA
jgi:hypothetical protein